MRNAKTTAAALILGLAITMSAAAEGRKLDYQVLSTSRTSTMEKELNQAGASGYRFLKVSNSPTVFGGKELVVVTVKDRAGDTEEARQYKVLSVRGNSNLQKKLKEAGDEGYEYLGQTTMPNVFGGTDVIVILERKSPKE
jgi:translation elongation factor EF-1beta